MELFQEHPYESVLQSCEWLVTHGEIQPGRLLDHAPVVGKGVKTLFAVITAHPLLPYASEGHVAGG